jgi:pimeloyl-ACP methyl ester carboxylesterase
MKMKNVLYISAAILLFATQALSQKTPEVDAFTVIKKTKIYGPTITSLLRYQTEMAWKQDELRKEAFKSIKTDKDLQSLQLATKDKLLKMIGGLPDDKTPLRSQTLDTIPMKGFRIEKLVFESIPGFYVTALVYVPENGAETHPAVLVACGHSPIAKIHYQALCQRLVQRGYLVICWDPVGQGERSQFWNAASGGSRYNMVCGEHAVLGNLAYLAGANLARWQIWDGIRAVDYLLTRADVDAKRISITGTSGGGLQATYIAALDERIQVVMPSCYISAQPMRAYNRIFADPDSDPEQDLDGMISEGVDHPGLLLLIYPRPVFIAAAVLDFFPIEGARKTFREISELYDRFHIRNRIDMVEGYHKHQFSLENQEAAFNFLDRFNNMVGKKELPAVNELDKEDLQCTQSGQVLLQYPNSKNLTGLIKEYFLERQNSEVPSVSSRYYGTGYPNIKNWTVSEYKGTPEQNIAWQQGSHYEFEKIRIDHYVLHHTYNLQIPVLYFHSAKNSNGKTVLWINLDGKASQLNWAQISKLIKEGFNVVSFDFRGTGEDRMLFEATSADNLNFAKMDSTQIYYNSLSGVFSNYVYNALLTGRPYYLQMIEDTEIVSRFVQSHLNAKTIEVTATTDAKMLAYDIAETLPGIKPQSKENIISVKWSQIVEEERELWPIHYLLPGGAYIR